MAQRIIWSNIDDEFCPGLMMSLDNIRKAAETSDCGQIICYGRLGLWNGAAFGYRLFDGLDEVFYSDCDLIEWRVDEDGDLIAEAKHHDGCNSYLYREVDCDDDMLDELVDLIYKRGHDKELVKRYLAKYTKPLGPRLAEVGI